VYVALTGLVVGAMVGVHTSGELVYYNDTLSVEESVFGMDIAKDGAGAKFPYYARHATCDYDGDESFKCGHDVGYAHGDKCVHAIDDMTGCDITGSCSVKQGLLIASIVVLVVGGVIVIVIRAKKKLVYVISSAVFFAAGMMLGTMCYGYSCDSLTYGVGYYLGIVGGVVGICGGFASAFFAGKEQ
jgi:hypothetical protein